MVKTLNWGKATSETRNIRGLDCESLAIMGAWDAKLCHDVGKAWMAASGMSQISMTKAGGDLNEHTKIERNMEENNYE